MRYLSTNFVEKKLDMKKNLTLFVAIFCFSMGAVFADNGTKNLRTKNAENLLFVQRISQVTYALKTIHLEMKATRHQQLDDMILKSSQRPYMSNSLN